MAYNLMAFASFGAKKYREGVDWASYALNHMPRYAPAHNNFVVCLVGSGDVAKARVAFDLSQALAPEYFRSRLDGGSSYAREDDRRRATTFLRIAAGLENPSAADALR
jgi:hypothetical protein